MWGVICYHTPANERTNPKIHADFKGWFHKKVTAQRLYNEECRLHPEIFVDLVKRAEHHNAKN